MSKQLPSDLAEFIESEEWTYAKTYPTWPHEYLVRAKVDDAKFMRLVRHINKHGDMQRFYRTRRIYFEHAGRLYWTMDRDLSVTAIINRCLVKDSYESRLAAGTLP